MLDAGAASYTYYYVLPPSETKGGFHKGSPSVTEVNITIKEKFLKIMVVDSTRTQGARNHN